LFYLPLSLSQGSHCASIAAAYRQETLDCSRDGGPYPRWER
jgi:hypothetical protein